MDIINIALLNIKNKKGKIIALYVFILNKNKTKIIYKVKKNRLKNFSENYDKNVDYKKAKGSKNLTDENDNIKNQCVIIISHLNLFWFALLNIE